LDDILNGTAADATAIYGVGQYPSGDAFGLGWGRVAAFDKATGAPAAGWPSSGILCTGSLSASVPSAIASDSTHLYVVGVEGNHWRIEKRQK
jgi:hypothetical protein